MNELEKESEVAERRQWGPLQQWRKGKGWHWDRMLQNCVLTGMRSNNDDYMWSWVTGDYWVSFIFNLRLTPRKLLDLLVLKLWENFQICGLSLSPHQLEGTHICLRGISLLIIKGNLHTTWWNLALLSKFHTYFIRQLREVIFTYTQIWNICQVSEIHNTITEYKSRSFWCVQGWYSRVIFSQEYMWS